MLVSGAEFVIKIDPEAAEVFRGLTGRIDKLIEVVERMEKNPPTPRSSYVPSDPVIHSQVSQRPPRGSLPYYIPGPNGSPMLVFPESD
jgi:hypothetical protein